jgi:Glycosyltransferase Family 4
VTGGGRALRVALVPDPATAPLAGALAAALRGAGHAVTVVASPSLAAPEALLLRRGFTESLTCVPFAARALGRGDFDVAHAFTPPGVLGALLWRRFGGGAVVFTCAETLARARLADRRLRLRTLAAAVERSDAVVAPDEASRTALLRWMAVDAPVLGSGDAGAHVRLYRELLAHG